MPDENIVVSFEGVKMKEFRAYWTAVARGDWAGQDKFFARVVKSWKYEVDPNDPSSYGELELNQYIAVQTAIKVVSQQLTHAISNPSSIAK